jgi:hypothetical protein
MVFMSPRTNFYIMVSIRRGQQLPDTRFLTPPSPAIPGTNLSNNAPVSVRVDTPPGVAASPEAKTPKSPESTLEFYTRTIEQKIRGIRQAVKRKEWDFARINSAALAEIFMALEKNPNRAARLLDPIGPSLYTGTVVLGKSKEQISVNANSRVHARKLIAKQLQQLNRGGEITTIVPG